MRKLLLGRLVIPPVPSFLILCKVISHSNHIIAGIVIETEESEEGVPSRLALLYLWSEIFCIIGPGNDDLHYSEKEQN